MSADTNEAPALNYRIIHTTTYDYSVPVPVCRNRVLLAPRESPSLHCREHRLTIQPAPTSSSQWQDYYGNRVYAFSIEERHRRLVVSAVSEVSVASAARPEPAVTEAWERVVAGVAGQDDPGWFEACEFTFDSPQVVRSAEFAAYAGESFSPGRTVLEGLLDLTRRIHAEFRYDTSATHVATRPEDAFRQRHGVCQDFAHVEIACLRSLGLPARYVSGYLRTVTADGQPRLVGADQSHAWVAAWCGAAGWIDVDPTNNLLCATDHVPVACGRDYGDVAPIRGVFLGGGAHRMHVSVDVSPAEPSVIP